MPEPQGTVGVLDSLEDVVLLCDMEGRVMQANRAACRRLGWSLDELRSMSLHALVAPAAVEGIPRLMEALSAKGKALFETELQTRGGGRMAVEASVTLVEEGGEPMMLAVGRDIARRLEAERALQRSHREWQATFDAMSDWVALLDADGTILRSNDAGARLMGVEPSVLPGKRCCRLVHGTDDLHPDCPLRRSAQTGQRESSVVELSDGRWLSVTVVPLSVGAGRPTAWVHVARDVTAQVHADRALRSLNKELERRVAERTRELAAANAELESFAYSVSHDLRAPLRGIDGWSQALLEDYAPKLDEQAREWLGIVRAEAQRMGALIEALLKLSRLSRAEMRSEPVDLTALGRQALARLAEAEPTRQVRAEVEEGMTATGDAALLAVVVDNLLGNAWKYSGKTSEPRVRFETTLTPRGKAFAVRDNGAGFDMAYASRLFTPFQRLHRADEFPGTGIGLATVQRAVRRHGGEVWAEGEVGKGATFYFTLPN